MSDRLSKDKLAVKSPWRMRVWLLCGIALVAMSWVVAREARQGEERVLWTVPWLLTILLGVMPGLVYLLGVWLGPRGKMTTVQMVVLVGVAIAMRVVLWAMPGVGGWDYWRYLWDGAVTASGVSPYRYSPEAVLAGEVDEERIEQLGQEGRNVLEKINHPHLRTIYPPVAQGLFAVAHWMGPFSLRAWWLVLLCFDVLAAFVVLALLRAEGRSLGLWAVYLWNPLLVTETYYGGHVDLMAGALVILFAWAVMKRRGILAAVVLAVAVGIKLWPGVLVFFLSRAVGNDRRKLLLSLGVFVGLVALMMVPYYVAMDGESDSGLISYARNWQVRAGAYQVFESLGLWFQARFSLEMPGQLLARGLSAMLLLAAAVWLGLKGKNDGPRLYARMGMVLLLMLLLGPVCWPWYYVALIPLAAAAGGPAVLLVWTVLLPLGYLPQSVLPDWAFMLIGHLPVWLLLGIKLFSAMRARLARGEK